MSLKLGCGLCFQRVEQEEIAESKDLDAKQWYIFAVPKLCDVEICLRSQQLRAGSISGMFSISRLTLGVNEMKQGVDEIWVLLLQYDLARRSFL